MTSATATLKAMLGLDTKAYQAGLKNAEQATRNFGSVLSTAGKTLGAAFSVGAIMAAGKALVSWASDASQAAQNVGILTSEMIALNKVAIQNDLAVGDMQKLLAKVSNELYNAASGSDESAKKFSSIGLAVSDLIGKDPVQLLQSVAEAAVKSGAPLEEISEIFGEKLGPNAMSALKQLAEDGLPAVDAALGQTADLVEEMGDKWNVMWDDVKAQAVSTAATIADELDTIGRALGRAIYNWTQDADSSFDSAYQSITKKKGEERTAAAAKRTSERAAAKAARTKVLSGKLEESGMAKYYKDMKAEEARRSKERAVVDRGNAAIAELKDRSDERRASISGNGINADSMAKMGGFTGPQRAGLGIADRQMKLDEENLQYQKEHKKILDQMNEKLAEIRDKATSGGGI